MCWCDGPHDLFYNSGNVNKYGYSGGCGDNDGNDGGGGRYFCNSSDVCYCINFCGAKRSDGEMQVMVMVFYFIFYDVEGCVEASGVRNNDGYNIWCGDNDGDSGGVRPLFF